MNTFPRLSLPRANPQICNFFTSPTTSLFVSPLTSMLSRAVTYILCKCYGYQNHRQLSFSSALSCVSDVSSQLMHPIKLTMVKPSNNLYEREYGTAYQRNQLNSSQHSPVITSIHLNMTTPSSDGSLQVDTLLGLQDGRLWYQITHQIQTSRTMTIHHLRKKTIDSTPVCLSF